MILPLSFDRGLLGRSPPYLVMPISPPSFHSSPPVSLIPWPLVCTEYREEEKAEKKGVSECEDDDGEKEEQGGGGDPTDGIRQQLPLLPSTWDKKGASRPLSLCPRGKQDDRGGIKITQAGCVKHGWHGGYPRWLA